MGCMINCNKTKMEKKSQPNVGVNFDLNLRINTKMLIVFLIIRKKIKF